jgi:hypothetical protein
VLDSRIFSSIIYILCAGGSLSPPVGTQIRSPKMLSSHIPGGTMAKKAKKAAKKAAKKR